MLRPKNAGYFLVLFAPLACAAPDASEDPIEWLGAVPGADLSSGGTGGR